jgi:5-methylcytosine-specific restriction protein A
MVQELGKRPAYTKWYKTAIWQRLRNRQLSREPLCRYCAKHDITKPANIVDHIKPHKGDAALFFCLENLQSLCKVCHDTVKARLERKGVYGCDANGHPEHWR